MNGRWEKYTLPFIVGSEVLYYKKIPKVQMLLRLKKTLNNNLMIK